MGAVLAAATLTGGAIGHTIGGVLARISHEFRRVHMQGARCEGVLGHVERRATQQMRPTGLARRASPSVTVCQEEPRTQNAQSSTQTAAKGQSVHVNSWAGEKCGLGAVPSPIDRATESTAPDACAPAARQA